MHRTLRELLPEAVGESHLVVVVFLDVRGFSSFARLAESAEAALFLRSAYTRILGDYFPDAAFFKPTGDGLLIVLDYDDTNLKAVVGEAVATGVRLVQDFSTLTVGDPMVNFPVPEDLGIGIARGAATALVSGDKVLDYSGRPLNLAARLMDLARPSGVVFSDNLVVELLEEDLAQQFTRDEVYVKGVAEDAPTGVWVLSERVVLPESSRRPINRFEWKTTATEQLTLKALAERGRYLYVLPEEPALPGDIKVHFVYPTPMASGRRHSSMEQTHTRVAPYLVRLGVHGARIEHTEVVDRLTQIGVKPAWPVSVTVEYAVPAT